MREQQRVSELRMWVGIEFQTVGDDDDDDDDNDDGDDSNSKNWSKQEEEEGGRADRNSSW